MKLTPASRALAMMRCAVGSSVAPPNIMVPRQSGETFRPLRPRLRYSTRVSLNGGVQLKRCTANRFQTIPPVGNLPKLVFAIYLGFLANHRAAEPLVEAAGVRILFEYPKTQRLGSARKQGIRKRRHQASPAAAPLSRAQHVNGID